MAWRVEHQSIAGHWHVALDARVAALLLRAHYAPSPHALLSTALSIDPPVSRQEFFKHLFSDTDYDRGGQVGICLRLELLPTLLQRTVASVLVMHAHHLLRGVLQFCVERAQTFIKDTVWKLARAVHMLNNQTQAMVSVLLLTLPLSVSGDHANHVTAINASESRWHAGGQQSEQTRLQACSEALPFAR
jgi:hypothetical protein